MEIVSTYHRTPVHHFIRDVLVYILILPLLNGVQDGHEFQFAGNSGCHC